MVRTVDAGELRRVVFSNKEEAIVLFTGSWCVDCTAFRPIWEKWARSRPGPIFVLEIERGSSAWQDWDLAEIPTVAVFRDGSLLDKASDRIGHDDLERLWGMIGRG